MKKIFISLAVLGMAVLGLSSCNKEAAGVADNSGTPIRIVVDVNSPATKAVGVTPVSGQAQSADEAKVNTLQIFVFNGEALDGYGSSVNSLAATVSCTAGSREIYAIANAPSLASVTSKSALLSSVSSLANEPANFQMIGSKTETLRYDGTVSVDVRRLASRVVIRGIKNALANAAQAADFQLVSVYLTNVAGDVNFGLSSTYVPTQWYNRRGYEASNSLGSFDYDAIGQTLAAGATYSDAHYFYSYPNSFSPASGGAWSPRGAKLVIRARIAGVLFDYPIEIGVMQNNKSYEISVVNITRVGNVDDGNHDPNDPDDIDEERPVSGFEQNFQINVVDWDVVPIGGGEITI